MRRSGIALYDVALASAEQKLLRALGTDARAAEELASGTVVAEADQAVARHLRALLTAVNERRVVEIEYAAVSSGRATRRGLEPYLILNRDGDWYVVGRCQLQQGTRTFRVDRIASLTATERAFDVPADFDPDAYRRKRLYVPGADAVTVKVRLDKVAVAKLGAARPAGDVLELPDGGAEIAIECEGFEWVVGWALELGSHAEILSPPDAREAIKARVQKMLADM
jgi:predicted DNA-binding transcriptional regulator YafY